MKERKKERRICTFSLVVRENLYYGEKNLILRSFFLPPSPRMEKLDGRINVTNPCLTAKLK